MEWKDELYERTKNEETVFNMKKFKVEGWYRYNDEKDFESEMFCGNDYNDIEFLIDLFKSMYENRKFYKIDIIEIV